MGRCLKWGGGSGGHLGIFSKTSKNRGWVKAKVVRRGRGLKVSPPMPSRKILIIHIYVLSLPFDRHLLPCNFTLVNMPCFCY